MKGRKIIVIVGFPSSGKSTYAKKLLTKYSGAPTTVCALCPAKRPAEEKTTFCNAPGFPRYKLGSLNWFGLRQANVHSGVYDANCSRIFS